MQWYVRINFILQKVNKFIDENLTLIMDGVVKILTSKKVGILCIQEFKKSIVIKRNFQSSD